jgi:dUTP pyrophosphatase
MYKNSNIILPRRATSKSAAYDIYSPTDFFILPKSEFLLWTDVKVSMESDEVFDIITRSSLGIKQDIVLKNLVGKIDSDYYSNKNNDGAIGLCLKNTGWETRAFKAGDRLCQGTFYKYLITDDDCPISEERVGGIGSTT